MEGLLGILVGIVFLVSSFINASRKFKGETDDNRDNDEIEKKLSDMFSEDTSQDEDDQPYVPAYEEIPETRLQEEIKSDRVESGLNHEKNDKNNKNKEHKKAVEVLQEKNAGEKEAAILEEDDLVRGVIFKEILDKPRAKRPYRPPYRS